MGTFSRMPPGLAAKLSSGEIGYYTAIATAIPVLLVAYVVGVQGFIRETLVPRVEKTRRNQSRRLFDVARDVGNLSEVLRTLGYTLTFLLYRMAGYVLLLAAVILPATGEIAALRALLGSSPSSELQSLSEIGVIAAGVVVVFPLTFRVLRIAFFSSPLTFIAGELALTLFLTGLLTMRWKPSARSLIDPEVRLVYIGGDGITIFRGSDSLDEFASLAWRDGRQPAGSVLPINEREVLVFDGEADPARRAGATRYARRGFRLVRLVAYASAEDARTQLAMARDSLED
jgi:hypothetical protein